MLKHEATDRELRVIIRNGRLTKDEYGNSSSVWNRYSVNLYLPSDPAIQKAQERIARRESNRFKDDEMLADLRRLWKAKGWLSSTLIATAPGLR